MIKILALFAAILLAPLPALAQRSIGGGVSGVTSSSPCLVANSSSGPSVAVSLAPQGLVIDETGTSGYTAQSSDACKIVKIGASSGGTPTLTVPQANTFPSNWGGAVYQNTGSVTVNVVAGSGSTSIFDGAGGGASFTLPADGWVNLTAESTNNWNALVSIPTITPPSTPTIVQSGSLSGSGCATSSSSSCTGTITATGAGHLLAIGAVACSTAGSNPCGTAGSAYTISSVSDGGDTCTLATGTDSGSTNARDSQWWNCPNIAAGRTSITVTWSTAVSEPNVYFAEVSGAATSSEIEAGSSNYTTTSPLTCTSGTTTVANDLLLVVNYNTDFTASSPWTTVIANLLWSQIGATLTTYSVTLTGTGGTEPNPCSIEAIKPS